MMMAGTFVSMIEAAKRGDKHVSASAHTVHMILRVMLNFPCPVVICIWQILPQLFGIHTNESPNKIKIFEHNMKHIFHVIASYISSLAIFDLT